jgi:hypothetical protein
MREVAVTGVDPLVVASTFQDEGFAVLPMIDGLIKGDYEPAEVNAQLLRMKAEDPTRKTLGVVSGTTKWVERYRGKLTNADLVFIVTDDETIDRLRLPRDPKVSPHPKRVSKPAPTPKVSVTPSVTPKDRSTGSGSHLVATGIGFLAGRKSKKDESRFPMCMNCLKKGAARWRFRLGSAQYEACTKCMAKLEDLKQTKASEVEPI